MNYMNDTTAPIKVLCAEDEHFISELYTRALSKAGYEVTSVIDGVETLKAAQTDAYDIILLDIMMPNMTGLEILDALRGPDAPKLKAYVIVATNLEQSEKDRAEVEQKADGYIVKADITPRELVEYLNQLNLPGRSS